MSKKTIYYNGAVYTGELPLTEAFVVESGRFVFAGSSEEALNMACSEGGDSLVNLKGRFVCSGFNDSHMHLLSFGNLLTRAQLAERTGSLADMVQCLKEFKKEHQMEEGWEKENLEQEGQAEAKTVRWLVGRGWNQDYFADVDRMPNRYDLDQVSEKIPVCAVRACGHCLVVNSKALELLGVTKGTPQPDGGRIGMEDGEPDGRFFDNAMDMVYERIPAPDKEALKDMIRSACRQLNRFGITSCQSDDYCVFSNVPWQEVNQVYKELEESGELTVRVYEQSNFAGLDKLQEFVEAGNCTGVGSELFRIGPLKLLGDGSLGSRTAYLSRPYADDSSTCGIPVFSQETLDEMIGYADRHGMQVAVHTIGDACLDRVLGAYEKVWAEHQMSRKERRHGVVHCQITRPDQLEKIAAMNLHVYAQSIFLDYDIQIVEPRVGEKLASTSYSWKTLMKKGVSVSNGSDCPVELPDVMAGIQCAVTRKNLKGTTGPYLPDEAFTVQEALDSYTKEGARASFEEKVKGQIQPGMMADFVVLEENPFAADPAEIKNIKILGTYLGGRQVFDISMDE